MEPGERKESYVLQCRMCGNPVKINIYPSDVEKYNTGKILVQHAFPYLSPADREMILSNTCGECWNRMFEGDIPDDH